MDIMKNSFWRSLFVKKDEEQYAVPKLTIDVHSHLLPGVDDGAKNIEDSIALIDELILCGYKKVITTPHVMVDSYNNTKKSILAKYKILADEVIVRGLNIEIEVAAEYYLDEGLMPLIQNNDLLLVSNKYLLFETSYTHRPQQLEEVIYEIQALGYMPLLAHPERYRYIKSELDEFEFLKERGLKFQLDLNSLNGYYGKQAKRNADYLSKHGMIDFLGSDTHHMKHVKNLQNVLDSNEYKEIYKNNSIQNKFL